MQNKEFVKNIALLQELETSVRLITLGFGELQNLNGINNFYFLPFQLLSQGFERLMKVVVCLGYLKANGALPSAKYIRDMGHDLIKIKKEIENKYFNDQSSPLKRSDFYETLANQDIENILSIVSEFGKMGRYYNFNVITSVAQSIIDPFAAWKDFEWKILQGNEQQLKKAYALEQEKEAFQYVTRYIIIQLEKFVAGLARQFSDNGLGTLSTQYSTSVFYFILLSDENYGKQDYRKFTSRYQSIPRRRLKRNLLDWISENVGQERKRKLLNKREFNKEWPFYVSSVVLELRHNYYCLVLIEGYYYALNGASMGRYKIENPHEAGVAILGIGLQDMISQTLSLKK